MKIYLSILSLVFGFVCLGNAQSAAADFSFTNANISGSQVEFDLKVKDFNDLTSFQLFFFYDETVLQVSEMSSTHPDFADVVLLKPENDNAHPQKGKFRLQWFDGLGGFRTLDDDEVLCTVVFDMVGDECARTIFELRDLGTVLPSERIEVLTMGNQNVGGITNSDAFRIPGQGCDTTDSYDLPEIATVRIYPNPVRDNLQVSFNNHTPISSSLMLYNEDGRLLSDNPLSNEESNIDISSINNGIYFYEIQDKGIVVHQGKIMKI